MLYFFSFSFTLLHNKIVFFSVMFHDEETLNEDQCFGICLAFNKNQSAANKPVTSMRYFSDDNYCGIYTSRWNITRTFMQKGVTQSLHVLVSGFAIICQYKSFVPYSRYIFYRNTTHTLIYDTDNLYNKEQSTVFLRK
jgi:hypothetical protein